MKNKFLVLLSILAVMCWAVVVSPHGAQATAALSLSDGSTTVTVIDGGVGDANPALAGVITYIGPIGANWYINVSTVISNSPTPHIDLNSIDVSSGSGFLDISFTDTGFIGAGTATIATGGTTTGTVSDQAWFDNGNTPFAKTTSIGSLGVFGGLAFSGTASSNVSTTNPFSLTELVEITHTGPGATSFNATVNIVPIPASVLLLGTGLLGLVGLGWRRKKQ